MKMRKVQLTIAVVLVTVTGCSGGTSASGGQGGGGSRPAFEAVLDRVHDDGTIDKDTALQAFALAFGPLPGVRPLSGAPEDILSGSGPLRWVLGHFSELTPAQQRAVRAAIGKPGGRALSRADGPVLMASTEQSHFEDLVKQARNYYASRLPNLSVPDPAYFVTLNNTNLEGTAYAYTYAVDANGATAGALDQCQIYFNPRARAASEAVKREAAFHEVFHCYQARMVPNLNDFARLSANGTGPGAWLVEGGALWAGDEGAGAGPLAASWWRDYFANPVNPLFKRTYDATGFFAHVQETGGDVFGSFPKVMQAISAGDVPAFNAFVSSSDRFFSTWPTGLLRQPSLGADWDTTGPGITRDAVRPGVMAIAGGASPGGSVLAYANDDRKLTVSAEVMLVATGQYSRLRESAGGSFDSSSPSDIYCTRSGGCTCPDGTPLAGTKFKQLDPGAYYLALSGGTGSNTWSIVGFSLDEFCKQPPVDRCLVGNWKLVSPPAIPGRVRLDRIDEVLSVTDTGAMSLDVNIAGSQEAGGGITVSVTVTGRATIQAVTVHGIIQPKSLDFSGLQAAATLNGTPFFNISLSQLFPGINNDLTPVAYRCTGNSLTLTSITGRQWGMSRS
jgi:hypothetical protein